MHDVETTARLAINNLMAQYNISGDRARFEGLAGCFWPDGILQIADSEFKGPDAIIAMLCGVVDKKPDLKPSESAKPDRPRPTFVRHHISTSLVTFESDTLAVGRTYFLVMTDIGPDHSGLYADRIEQRDGEWRFSHRHARTEWMHQDSFFKR